MTSTAWSVGKDVQSICGKCGTTWHVIVAMVGGQIAKVQCKECDAVHRFRPTEKPTPKSGAARASSAVSASDKPRAPRASRAPKAHQPLVHVDLSRPLRPYRMDAGFHVGDRIEHKTFGTGVVELVIPPNKVQVFFPDGRRTLIHQP
jgi:CxxC motif-containing protein